METTTKQQPARDIQVMYTSIDGVRKTGQFRTLEAASKFAQKWVGRDADVFPGSTYAVSFDGVGKVTVVGCRVYELFVHPDDITEETRSYYDAVEGTWI